MATQDRTGFLADGRTPIIASPLDGKGAYGGQQRNKDKFLLALQLAMGSSIRWEYARPVNELWNSEGNCCASTGFLVGAGGTVTDRMMVAGLPVDLTLAIDQIFWGRANDNRAGTWLSSCYSAIPPGGILTDVCTLLGLTLLTDLEKGAITRFGGKGDEDRALGDVAAMMRHPSPHKDFVFTTRDSVLTLLAAAREQVAALSQSQPNLPAAQEAHLKAAALEVAKFCISQSEGHCCTANAIAAYCHMHAAASAFGAEQPLDSERYRAALAAEYQEVADILMELVAGADVVRRTWGIAIEDCAIIDRDMDPDDALADQIEQLKSRGWHCQLLVPERTYQPGERVPYALCTKDGTAQLICARNLDFKRAK